ncbi:cell division protein FtsI (penicillin-binding protein 3) [Rhizobiales bacterium GAS191]|nr:cell division protein FtsI (penicillin-binding protein 3) [Rhizobiales bacterium GAS113]SED41138.1 cell division protein FtsI (penicillin-binding protein 3) [Rhizobiales bacterium GAS188]SEE94277.1 cell division protein FtsI (penicillin-binding protein 3) [Rhizobiales bacterium GAS191]
MIERAAQGEADSAAPARRIGRLPTMLRNLLRMHVDKSSARIILVALAFGAVYFAIIGRLVEIGLTGQEQASAHRASEVVASNPRPDIVDRNGEILATDVQAVSVFAEPNKLVDKDEAVELITSVLPDLDARALREKFAKRKGFVWVKRDITKAQRDEIYHLGLPGVGFLDEKRRIYPNGNAAAHILGAVNTDNIGIAGIEKYIDTHGLEALREAGLPMTADSLKPVQLALDLRAQHALRDELAKGMEHFKAKAAGAAIMDVNTGEVVAMVSLPDFDPNQPADALDPNNINRMTVGVFEMGSTYKALTTAMALDAGKINLNTRIDTRSNLRYGKFTIHDYHATHQILTVPEIFLHSSNIGTAKEALMVGVEGHKAFLKKAGQFDRMRTELESAQPLYPKRWVELNTVTAAFGQGIAVAPLQAAMAVCAVVNGGHLETPTFLRRSEADALAQSTQLIKPETSEQMRYILRLNAEKGSGRKADVPGYYVGAKTGTAAKIIHGHYSSNKNFTTFTAILPADKPKYLFLVVYDEPQAVSGTYGFSTAAWNAGTVTGIAIDRIAPILGIPPRFDQPVLPFPHVAQAATGLKQ